jgi:hypothetical protein
VGVECLHPLSKGIVMTNLEKFMFDVVVRVPSSSIILRGKEYWMYENISYTTKIEKDILEEIEEVGYITKQKNGVYVPTSLGIEFAHGIILEEVVVENHWRPGHTFKAHKSPEKWEGTL